MAACLHTGVEVCGVCGMMEVPYRENCTSSVVHLYMPHTCIIATVDVNTNLIEITCISDVTEWLSCSECLCWRTVVALLCCCGVKKFF